jgi:thiol-disulfide isomerase/thioredoxin
MKKIFFLFLFVAQLAPATPAPSFRNAELLGGGKTSLDALLKPKRVLLVSFWATWCLPCMQELTEVSKKRKEEPSLPLDVVTVNIDQNDRSEVSATMQQLGIDLPVILDPTKDIYGRYQKADSLPYSVLVTSDREIVETFNGYSENMFSKIREVALKRNAEKGQK